MYTIILINDENETPEYYYNLENGGYTRDIKYATKIWSRELANIIKDTIELMTKTSHKVIHID